MQSHENHAQQTSSLSLAMYEFLPRGARYLSGGLSVRAARITRRAYEVVRYRVHEDLVVRHQTSR